MSAIRGNRPKAIDKLRQTAKGANERHRGRNPFADFTVASIKQIPNSLPASARELNGKVRFALVSIPASQELACKGDEMCRSPRAGVDIDSLVRRPVVYGKDALRAAEDRFVSVVRQTLADFAPQVLCANELAFPASRSGPSTRVIREMKQLCDSAKCLIVGGSCHDVRTLYNSVLIFAPHPDGARSSLHYYHKQISATTHSPSEFISVPAHRQIRFVRCYGIKIAILTCLDLGDYSSAAPIVKFNDSIDVLLAPSYSHATPKLVGMAKLISQATGGCVMYVNCLTPGFPDGAQTYHNGAPMRPSVQKEVADCKVTICDLDVQSLQDERFARSRDELQDSDLSWLFGGRRVEEVLAL